jgi:predicted site-specific integrase-resolvase
MLPKETPPLLRLADASRIFNLSKSTLLRLRNKGAIKTFKTLGGQHMFFRDEILNYIEKNTNELQKPDAPR